MPLPSSSLSWNVSGKTIVTAAMLFGATAWLFYCSFQDFTDSSSSFTKADKKKDSKKKQEPQPHSKHDDRKGISPADLKAVLETKVTTDGDCISCRENLQTPTKKKSSPPLLPSSSPVESPVLPGLGSPFNTLKDADSSFGSSGAISAATSANESWDKLTLPPTPKKNARAVPPTPSNSLTIMLKNKKKSPKFESRTRSNPTSDDCRSDKSDKEMEKTQDDL